MTKILDLHGFTPQVAVKKIQKTIMENPKCEKLIAIHGFNRGNAIKNILLDHHNIHNNRTIKTIPEPFNEGRTWIYLKRC